MRSYWDPATLVVGEQSFEITCAVDEGQGRPGAPVGGWIARASELVSWEVPTATLRLPDGREAEVSVHGDMLYAADGQWPS